MRGNESSQHVRQLSTQVRVLDALRTSHEHQDQRHQVLNGITGNVKHVILHKTHTIRFIYGAAPAERREELSCNEYFFFTTVFAFCFSSTTAILEGVFNVTKCLPDHLSQVMDPLLCVFPSLHRKCTTLKLCPLLNIQNDSNNKKLKLIITQIASLSVPVYLRSLLCINVLGILLFIYLLFNNTLFREF